MQQHPVPQNITSYEFRLVGDMTLKQFGMLAGCCMVGLLFYASGLPGYFKWPLVLFCVMFGIVLAFIPLEERPLHRWIIAFFKAAYSPTQYVWQKKPKKLTVFESQPALVQKTSVPEEKPLPDEEQLNQFLQTLPMEKSALEKKESKFLEKLDHYFLSPSEAVATEPETKSSVTPITLPSASPSPSLPTSSFPSPKPMAEKPVAPVKVEPPKPDTAKPVHYQAYPQPVKLPPKKAVKEAKIDLELPFPQTPKTPNLIIGMVLNQQGKILENAILEIRDSQGIPIRALKTNRLGQFRIVTPLKNGEYEIETEKEGYAFDIIKIILEGEPVPPIEIRAK